MSEGAVMLLSIVIPVYNEEENLKPLVSAVISQIELLGDYEFVLVDDGSTDRSLKIISELASSNNKIKAVALSRNFGNQIAVSAGLDFCSGDAVITMDADFQHAPEVIPQLVKEWKNGAQVVLTKRTNLKMTAGSILFFKLMKKFSEVQLDIAISDFRLMDRIVVDQLITFEESSRFVRGLVHWSGFETKVIDITVPERFKGESKFNFSSLMNLASNGFFSFSLVPLRAVLFLGGLISLVGILALILSIIDHYTVQIIKARAIAYFMMINTIGLGLTLLCLGVIAEYVGIIHKQVQNRPLYLVKKKINL